MIRSIIALALAAPSMSFAGTLPAGATPEQARLVSDWQHYAMACKGGRMDEANRNDTLGYCGTRDYLMFRLSEAGLCSETGHDWVACAPSGTDPLKDFPF